MAGTNMQSDETLHRLGALDREMIEHRIQTIFERRAEGDLPGIMDYAADDIVYSTRGLWTLYPFSQPVRSKALVGQMLAMIEVMYENFGSTIHELVIDGDRAALHRTSRMRNRGTGALLSVDVCDFMRFRDGMVIEFSEYPDSAAIARLQAGA
jgi:ketosteroid isomerase-like protein